MLDQSDLGKASDEFFTKYEDMNKPLKKAAEAITTGKQFNVNVTMDSDTIKYALDSNLVHKFLKRY